MTALVVLGGADGSLGTISAARALGIRTICVDMRGDAPGAVLADQLVNISTLNADELLGVLAPIRDIAGVVSPASDVNLPSQYELAKGLGVPCGLSDKAVRVSVDKGYFRDVCDRIGWSGPTYVQGTPEQVLAAAGTVPLPAMVKPTDSSGSRGVTLIDDAGDLAAAVHQAAAFSISGVVIIEEYVPGCTMTGEAIIVDGRPELIAVSRRTLTPLPHFVTTEHRMPAPDVDMVELRSRLTELCCELDYCWGALNIDLMVDARGQLVPGEAGARLGGNGVAELLQLCWGVDATEAYVRMALGDSVDLSPRWNRCAAMHVFSAPVEGKLISIDGLEQASVLPGVEDIVLAVQPGELVHPYTRAGAKLGYALVSGADAAAVDAAIDRVRHTLRFEIEDAAVDGGTRKVSTMAANTVELSMVEGSAVGGTAVEVGTVVGAGR